jgi:hypothetical protein
MGGWFDRRDEKFEVTGTLEGWFGPRTVRKTVTGQRAADREAARLHGRGARDIRKSRGGWWAAR